MNSSSHEILLWNERVEPIPPGLDRRVVGYHAPLFEIKAFARRLRGFVRLQTSVIGEGRLR